MAHTTTLDRIIEKFPVDIQPPIRELTLWMQKDYKDFSALRDTVERLAFAQERTEGHMSELTRQVQRLEAAQERTEQRVEELAAAQARTEQRVEELATAQARTEQRVEELAAAQARTEQRVEELATEVKGLAAAQARTEQRVEELATEVKGLAAAQTRTEKRIDALEVRMEAGFKSLSDQIAGLGSRWGIYNEGTFRATIYGVLGRMEGVTVKEGYYGGRQVDVVIQNGEHILLEITSRMHAKDIKNLYESADDYREREGIEPKLMIATSYVSPKLMQKIMGLERPIDIFSYEGEE